MFKAISLFLFTATSLSAIQVGVDLRQPDITTGLDYDGMYGEYSIDSPDDYDYYYNVRRAPRPRRSYYRNYYYHHACDCPYYYPYYEHDYRYRR